MVLLHQFNAIRNFSDRDREAKSTPVHSFDTGIFAAKRSLELGIERFAQGRDSDIKAAFFHCRLAPDGVHQAPLGDQISFVLDKNEQSAKGRFEMEIEALAIQKQYPSNGVNLEWAKSKAHDGGLRIYNGKRRLCRSSPESVTFVSRLCAVFRSTGTAAFGSGSFWLVGQAILRQFCPQPAFSRLWPPEKASPEGTPGQDWPPHKKTDPLSAIASA